MRIAACLMALLALAACGQKGPLVRPGEGPANTRYIIKDSDRVNTPATPEAPTATADHDSEHHD